MTDFRDSENPYQTPTAESTVEAVPHKWLRIPAIATISLTSLWWLLLFIFPNALVADLSTGTFTRSLEALLVLGLFLYQVFMLFIIAGGVCMIRQRGLWLARLAAIASCIPFFSPFYITTIPFGIWALVLLFQSKTIERFHQESKSPDAVEAESNEPDQIVIKLTDSSVGTDQQL
jgi:hypothetical protein